MQHIPLQSICRSILGSAHSMGIKVIQNQDETTTDYTAARARNEELKLAKGGNRGGKGKKK